MTIIRVGVDIAKSIFMFTALTAMIKFAGLVNAPARTGWMLYASEYLPGLKSASKPALPLITGRESSKPVDIM